MPSPIHTCLSTFVLLFGVGVALAGGHPPAAHPSSAAAPASKSGKQPQATVSPGLTVHPGRNEQIREYRFKNRAYMVQIEPQAGTSYFLLDRDGDGVLETRYNDLDARVVLPDWVLSGLGR
jgi:hypothetical protein